MATSHKIRKMAGSEVDQGRVAATITTRISAGYRDVVGLKGKRCHIGLGANPNPYSKYLSLRRAKLPTNSVDTPTPRLVNWPDQTLKCWMQAPRHEIPRSARFYLREVIRIVNLRCLSAAFCFSEVDGHATVVSN